MLKAALLLVLLTPPPPRLFLRAEAAKLWKAALADGRSPARGGEWPAPHGELGVSCSDDGRLAVVAVPGCASDGPEETSACGAAVLELEHGRFTGFFPARLGDSSARFFGQALVDGPRSSSYQERDATEVRWGPRLERSATFQGRPFAVMNGGKTFVLVRIQGSEERLMAWTLGDAEAGPLGDPAETMLLGAAASYVPRSDLLALLGATGLELVDPVRRALRVKVPGATAYSVEPGGKRVLACVEKEKEKTLEYRTAGAGSAAVPSSLRPPAGTWLPLVASWERSVAAAASGGTVELVALAPLKVTAAVQPFDAGTKVTGLTLSADGEQLLVGGTEPYGQGSLARLAVLRTRDGKVLRWLDGSIESPASQVTTLELLGAPADRPPHDGSFVIDRFNPFSSALLQPDGGTVPYVAPGPAGGCAARAEALARELLREGPGGFLLPAGR